MDLHGSVSVRIHQPTVAVCSLSFGFQFFLLEPVVHQLGRVLHVFGNQDVVKSLSQMRLKNLNRNTETESESETEAADVLDVKVDPIDLAAIESAKRFGRLLDGHEYKTRIVTSGVVNEAWVHSARTLFEKTYPDLKIVDYEYLDRPPQKIDQ